MITWICRFLLLTTFAVFWGGLTLYEGIVVRIVHDVLPDPMDGGMITQRVTWWLQLLGAITVALMLWNACIVGWESRGYGATLGVCAIVLGAAIAGLFFVHSQLDAVIDIEAAEITGRAAFKLNHRRYNQLTTVEWLTSIAYLAVTVAAWRSTRPHSQRNDTVSETT